MGLSLVVEILAEVLAFVRNICKKDTRGSVCLLDSSVTRKSARLSSLLRVLVVIVASASQ